MEFSQVYPDWREVPALDTAMQREIPIGEETAYTGYGESQFAQDDPLENEGESLESKENRVSGMRTSTQRTPIPIRAIEEATADEPIRVKRPEKWRQTKEFTREDLLRPAQREEIDEMSVPMKITRPPATRRQFLSPASQKSRHLAALEKDDVPISSMDDRLHSLPAHDNQRQPPTVVYVNTGTVGDHNRLPSGANAPFSPQVIADLGRKGRKKRRTTYIVRSRRLEVVVGSLAIIFLFVLAYLQLHYLLFN